jgi:hypothetical protein
VLAQYCGVGETGPNWQISIIKRAGLFILKGKLPRVPGMIKTGTRKYRTEIVAFTMQFIGGNGGGAPSSGVVLLILIRESPRCLHMIWGRKSGFDG